MKGKLMKQGGRYVLYAEGGHKIACTSDSPHKKLSLKNCQAIELGYDLDELADEVFEKRPKEIPYVDEYDFKQGVMVGFQKALEILGDKKFTYNQMVSAITESSISHRLPSLIIQDLQQTEWDVEVEMICPHPMDTYRCGIKYGCDEDGCNHPEQVPYLDADGCLILKRK